MALPLCPPHRIEEAFELMRQEVANMSPAVDAFAEEYLDYIRATYMNGNYGTATDGFEWNVYDDVEQGFLTNNPSEGANNRLRTRAGVDHPGIYRFCELMRQETENTKNKCEQFEEGVLQPGQANQRTSKVAHNRVHLKAMLERGQTSLRKYLRALGRMTHIVKNKPRRGGQVGAASIMREALASVADDQDGAPPPPRRTRGARGGRMGRAGGARGRGAAPRYRCVRILKTNSFTD